ncbi:hypothetical protein K505DRAFT_336933 [Melanomma pulvis-pyrius CBS 109.77]|uniref:Zn(2)-C6 fungal-type domain-containing protein n=1 Tax=Melanomma pulvis-pyrius CBS 109.77 TaxID=1314802 RepID=A0A6A6XDB7_9PLEO|nr:hypothetical protein K505DRAFT_336933 [Melanomma pulvis-pyrius CBS 109.77]
MEKPKSRKPHKKSRNGCLPCKARHVKCDETKPECVNCDKYGMKCEYPPPKKRISPVDHISPNLVASTPSSIEDASIFTPNLVTNGPQELGLSVDSVQCLRLMHHFHTITAKTLVVDSAEDFVQTHLVKTAFSYRFLLHSILALAALHLSRIEQSLQMDYMHQAERHHDAAVGLFRDQIQDIDETNIEAVLFFAATLDPYSSAVPMNTNDPDHAFDGILQSFALTRRLRPMVAQFYPKLSTSEFARLIPPDTQGMDWGAEPPADSELTKFRKFSEVIQHLYPPDIIEAYGNAIRILELLFARVAQLPDLPSAAFVKLWVHHVDPRFLELLSERQPGALIIFAHYGVLLRRVRHYWFMEGYAEQVLHIADMFVPGEWKAWLDWPREQISAGREAS